MSKLAEIRAKLAAQENRGQSTQKTPSDTALFPFWNIKEGETAQIRFLPDADPNNSFFWVEKAMINLTFAGVKGTNDTKEYMVKVPCMEMYGENCQVLAEVRTWYKDDSLKEMANKYWKKRTYLFQGFVKTNPLTDDTHPENPIRRFTITPQVFNIIKSALTNPEIEELPTDYQRGLNFNIIKGTKGGWSDYSTSAFARRETALTEAELAAIDSYGLFDLKSYLPKKPSESEQRIIKDMFDASVDGRPYDLERWGAYYKPWGLDGGESRSQSSDSDEQFETKRAPIAAPVARPVVQSAPVAESAPIPSYDEDDASATDEVRVPAAKSNANDILALIRSRQNKPA